MDEVTQLLTQIFLSEVDYHVIKQRRDNLQALPSRTPQEDAKIIEYQAKLDHDEAVVLAWVQRIATLEGRTVIQVRRRLRQTASILALRAQILQDKEQEFENAAIKEDQEANAEEAQRPKLEDAEDPVERLLLRLDQRTQNAAKRRAYAAKLLGIKMTVSGVKTTDSVFGA